MNKFKVAFKGLASAYRHHSVKIQVVLGVLAIIGGIIIRLNYLEWLIFIICIFSVIASEVINTCIESLCDLVINEYDERVKRIKDMASSFVLIEALMALVICVLVTVNKLGGLFNGI